MSIKADPTEFADKRVLVSGGTKGLGRATVERFLAGGASVITAARTIKDTVEGVEYADREYDLIWRSGLGHVIGLDERRVPLPTLQKSRGSRPRWWRRNGRRPS